jgi:hypothetical protein
MLAITRSFTSPQSAAPVLVGLRSKTSLVLIAIELFHPGGFTRHPGMYEYLSKPEPYRREFAAIGYFGPKWWFALHLIQTPVVALVAVGWWLVVGRVDRAAPLPTSAMVLGWLSRAATLTFLVCYTTLDSIAGTGLGQTILIAKNLAGQGLPYPGAVEWRGAPT